MYRPELSSSDSPVKKKESRLQGPRPPQLKVSQDSFKIKKPPPHPHPFPPAAARPPLPRPGQRPPQPMIIYDISPKAILIEENDFMSVVQRLTGSLSSSSSFAYCGGDLSPAARLASMEKASSPSERKRIVDANDVMSIVEASVELRPAPGVLSQLPATLPQIPDGFFSPVTDQYTLSFLGELSPYWQNGNGGFMASPTLFSAPINTPINRGQDEFCSLPELTVRIAQREKNFVLID